MHSIQVFRNNKSATAILMASVLVLMAAALPVYAASPVYHGSFDLGVSSNPCNPTEIGDAVVTGTVVIHQSANGMHFTSTITGDIVFGSTNLGLTWIGHVTLWDGGNVNSQGTLEGSGTMSGQVTASNGQTESFNGNNHITVLADGTVTIAFSNLTCKS